MTEWRNLENVESFSLSIYEAYPVYTFHNEQKQPGEHLVYFGKHHETTRTVILQGHPTDRLFQKNLIGTSLSDSGVADTAEFTLGHLFFI